MLLSVIILVSFLAALTGYQASMDKAGAVLDGNMSSLAHALDTVPFSPATLLTNTPGNIIIQIWKGNELLAMSSNAPVTPITSNTSGYGEQNFSGQRWRTYTLLTDAGDKRIIVAQSVNERIDLSEQLALASLSPLVIVTPFLALLILITINRGLLPLKKLSQMLKYKATDNFEPVVMNNTPAELLPVIKTINRLLRRVGTAFEREKRFASDAAHELRTPISVLRVSIHNLSLQHPELENEMHQLDLGVQRMAHVVEQILLLNRTHEDHFTANFRKITLASLCRKVIAESYDQIDRKRQTIELRQEPVTIEGDEFSLGTLLQNLINNASRYTPEGGNILVSLGRSDGFAIISVEDSGPGISEQDRERVLDRFYRVGGDQHTSGLPGCGLGMAIVKQVCELHNGDLVLSRSPGLRGLQVIVTLPIQHRKAL